MLPDWFVPAQIRMTWEEFQKLPRHPAYRYEYRNGELRQSGRPILRNCRIKTEFQAASKVDDRIEALRLSFADLKNFNGQALTTLFKQAFARSAPYFSLSPAELDQAVQDHFLSVLQAHPWPIAWSASRLLLKESSNEPVAASVVTLVPDANWTDFTDPKWQQQAPPDALEKCWGHPHLTWIFVSPQYQRHGIGSILLSEARNEVRNLGYRNLFSTFLVGDYESMLWHWKQGFELIPSGRIDSAPR